MGLYAVGIDDRIDKAGGGLQTTWRVVAAVFLLLLLVAAGVTIERAADRKDREIQGLVPTGFGQLQQSTYAISESSGQFVQPRTIVSTADWTTLTLPKIGIELAVPQNWKQVGDRLDSDSVVFEFSSNVFASKQFVIRLMSNPKRSDPGDFFWQEYLGFTVPISDGVRDGSVELGNTWLVDGTEAFSAYYPEGGQAGEYIIIPRGSDMLVLYAEDLRFSPANKELFTVIATITLL
jgi:hypothetical protein